MHRSIPFKGDSGPHAPRSKREEQSTLPLNFNPDPRIPKHLLVEPTSTDGLPLAEYPPPPDGHQHTPYYWILGWPMASPKYQHFVRKVRRDNNNKCDSFAPVQILREILHSRRLFVVTTLRFDAEFPERSDMTDHEYGRVPAQKCLGIAHTAPGRSLKIRPYDLYYQRIKLILGEPQWMKDSFPKAMWDIHGLETYS
ncbi:hypothetical protein EUX98_g2833 [Antrodiella citrinella]|uniref:Uncharacterized protein n=1 Tax=Antrodiella citrinella TaxID=2447956 RepID=A0A4S4N0X4_9APHY|nr:hypothetical protein EUX98_g2833 [Antrodiella citrinella]